MVNEGNVPEVRFDGFEESWEARPLGEVGKPFTGLSGKTKNDFGYGDATYVTYMNVFSNPIASSHGTDKVNMDGKQNSVQYGDVLFTISSETPDEVGMSSVWLENIPHVYLNSFCFGYRSKDRFFDPYYLAFMLRSQSVRDKFKLLAQGSTRFNISKNEAMKISVPIPCIGEQTALGDLFRFLENTIALKKQQYEQTINIKKSMLEKMFPKKGADIPEIRFDGFTEPWTASNLGDVAYFRRGSFPQPYGRAEWYDGESSMPFVQVVDVAFNLALVDNTKQQISALAQPKSVFVPKGSVVVTLQGSIGRVALTQYDSYVDRTLLIFEDYKADICKQFWAYIVQELFDREKRVAPGGTIKTITKDALTSFEIKIPGLPEQIAIGNFFHNLDTLIASQQQELKKLQNIKKACLSKMFV